RRFTSSMIHAMAGGWKTMIARHPLAWGLVLVALSGGTADAQNSADQSARTSLIERVATAVNEELSGEQARETVAFVEKRWRLPGNAAFDESLDYVVDGLRSAGFQPESAAGASRLVYRVERRPMERLAWEPVDASLTIVGQDSALLRFETNRNMVAINSFATPETGVEADLVDGGDGSPEALDRAAVRGRIVFARAPLSRLYQRAVVE